MLVSLEVYLFCLADESLKSRESPRIDEKSSPSKNGGFIQADGSEDAINLLIYPYERLKVVSTNPIAGIDVAKREVLLLYSSSECQEKE